MKKIIGLLVLVGIFSSTPIFAHSGLEESTPADGETVTDTIEEISLQFSTVIEESSTVSIEKEGTAVEIGSIEIDQDSLTAIFTEPLSNGTYDVTWDIIGEDGHEIQDVYSFTVEGQEEDETIDETDETTVEEDEEEFTDSSSSDVDSSSTNSLVMPIIIALLAFVAIGSTVFFLRRKKE